MLDDTVRFGRACDMSTPNFFVKQLLLLFSLNCDVSSRRKKNLVVPRANVI